MRALPALFLLIAGLSLIGCMESPGNTPPDDLQDAADAPVLLPAADSARLYPFPDGPLWGYIDGNGTVRIKPRFRAAGQFAFGLAPVREGGLYGYIDSTGGWAIAPRFDYATPFDGHTARVYPNGQPALLQRDGNVVLIAGAAAINPSGEKDVWILETVNGRKALLSAAGSLLTDTAFGNITAFEHGRAVVQEWQPARKNNGDAPRPRVGVINTAGKFVVPLGKYSDLSILAGGYIEASPPDNAQDMRYSVHYLHPSGRFIFSDTMSVDIFPVFEQAGDGVIPVRYSRNGADDFMGLHDTTGVLLFRDRSLHDLTTYAHGVALASRSRFSDSLVLIDKRGKPVVPTVFSGAAFPPQRSVYKLSPFVDDKAVVILNDKVVLIDTAGRVIKKAPSTVRPYDHRSLERSGHFVLFSQRTSRAGGEDLYRYGFWNLRTGAVAKAAYKSINPDAFPNGLIPAYDAGDRLIYLNENGREIFRAPRRQPLLNQPLNIAVMNRGYLYASGPPVSNSHAIGGYGGSENRPQPLGRGDMAHAAGSLTLRIDGSAQALAKEDCLSHTVMLANTGRDTMFFEAQDSRLYAVLQARDASGAWRDIEYLPSSWCGNSYHTMALPPQHQWTFNIPHYEGSIPTHVRLKLLKAGRDAEEPKGEYFSNEVPMSVNPGQFWNKRTYTPAGLMDPYND